MLTRREIALLSTLIHRHMATIKRRSSEDEAEWEFRLNGFEELATKLKGMYEAPKQPEQILPGPVTFKDWGHTDERPKAGDQAEEHHDE